VPNLSMDPRIPFVRKSIVSECKGRRPSIAWLSFQPDGSISFGLNDRAFYSPRLGASVGIFNAYNRVRLDYVVTKDGAGKKPIKNPHFTYHPSIIQFHLTGNGDEDVFTGIMDPMVIQSQQSAIEWIRATSRPLSSLSESHSRADGNDTETWGNSSLRRRTIASNCGRSNGRATSYHAWSLVSRYVVPWFKITTCVTISAGPPQEASLAWFHEY
jgi:hypothetical protein